MDATQLIKEQGQKLVYKNEVIETQAEKLLCLRDEKAELQKQVDAVKRLAQTLWEKSEEKHHQGKVWESKTLGECADEILDVLEQALKGCDMKISQELSLSELRGNNV